MEGTRKTGKALGWLYPGLNIKRWLLLAFIGFLGVLFSAILLIGPALLSFMERAGHAIPDYFQRPLYASLILAAGLFLIVLGLIKAIRAVRDVLSIKKDRAFIDILFTSRYLQSGPNIVTIGGGTGLSILLRELKEYTSNLTAVVTVTDDGGSSGRLRWELGMLPPGDIRSCLLAMADTEPLMEKLFQHRFGSGADLEGHSFGNLLIAAMTEMFGFQEAVKLFGEVLAIRGKVFPVTLEMVQLEAEDMADNITRGQSVLYSKEGPLKRISLIPDQVEPLPEVLAAINGADAVVLGPGSLFTSIIPNLLVKGITEALLNTSATVFYVCNVMTQPGETTGFTAADHVEALYKHSCRDFIDRIIVNSDLTVVEENLKTFWDEGGTLVVPDYHRLRPMSPRLISGALIDHTAPSRHRGTILAQLIIEQTLKNLRKGRGGGLGKNIYGLGKKIRSCIRGD